MTTIARQPFAPLDGSRLQTLTSVKNRQNAISTSPVKRKASDIVDADDSENLDPVLFSKRSKGTDSFFPSKDLKSSTVPITKSASNSNILSPTKDALPCPRNTLQPKSPAAKLNTHIAKSSTFSAPPGRSPFRGKRIGILSSRRRTASPFTRVDPPVFGLSKSNSSAPFSLDAALKGTIPSYTRRTTTTAKSDLSDFNEGMKSSWFFDIHEDTPEQEMTNLLQHSTCVLDISSDEESETRRQRERAEGKENVPPSDDVSQISRPRAARLSASADEMIVEKERIALGDLDARDYYAEGCDEASVIIIPVDEEEQQQQQQLQQLPETKQQFEFSPELKIAQEPQVADGAKSIDELMEKTKEPTPCASVLQPIEGTGESFEVWESGSVKDEGEVGATA